MSPTNFLPEEDWESDISRLLGGLPDVAPPDGFIEQALDHRPLFAGRVLAGFGGALVVAFGLAVALGGVGDANVVPQLGDLTAQHASAAVAVLDGPDDPGFCKDDCDAVVPDKTVEMSSEADLKAFFFEEEDLLQSVYELGGDRVSVFSERGAVDFDQLADDGTVDMIAGVPAWTAADGNVTVLQAADEVITIIGLEPEEVSAAIDTIPEPGFLSDVGRIANEFTSQLGFPDLQ